MAPWTDHDPIWPELLGKRRALTKPRIRVRRVSSVPKTVILHGVPILLLALFAVIATGALVGDGFFLGRDSELAMIVCVITIAALFWWGDLATNISIRRAQRLYQKVSGFENATPVTLKEFIRMDSDVSGVLWMFTLYGDINTFVAPSTAIMVFDDETDAMVFRVSR